MIITKTPLRISFLGGGTDYPDYFRDNGGQTLGAAIDKYSYVTVNRLAPLFDYKIRIGYSRTELVSAVDQIQHPSVRECLRLLNLKEHIEIGYGGDLPARSGLGSSSSFTVGLLHGLHALKGELVSHEQLAREAVHVEQEMIRERVGVQDQYICAFGGLVKICCNKNGRIDVKPIPLAPSRLVELKRHMLLFYTRINRQAHDVLDDQIDRTKNGKNNEYLWAMEQLVDEGLKVLTGNGDIREFGRILHESWLSKRQLSKKVSSEKIDAWYEQARKAGALGGKLLGAGGGGFLLIFARPEEQAKIIGAVPDLVPVNFDFDFTGSTLLFYKP